MWILISTPVYRREWILPYWFEAIEKQDFPLRKIGFTFELASYEEDPGTHELLQDWHSRHPEVVCFELGIDTKTTHIDHATHPMTNRRERTWGVGSPRYTAMATMRNELLDRGICLNPDRFFSLDSDIILHHPYLIRELVQLTASLDAVSPLVFMTPMDHNAPIDFPNMMSWAGAPGAQGFRPGYPYGNLLQADVIMAAVMMSRSVYQNARYQWHRQGEDLAWSADCALRGYELFNASYLYGTHIMDEVMLENWKVNGDPRLSCCEGISPLVAQGSDSLGSAE